ncbi:MAG: DNA starvation/stationary phase protection protein [Bacillota bacterium]|nr:DNA starvation/stationary phase protection protein [Bacillota bacterium]
MPVGGEAREALVRELNELSLSLRGQQLATKVAHWNVKGENFLEIHELFDRVASHLEEGVDLLAERAVQLGGGARGTTAEVAAVWEVPGGGSPSESAPERTASKWIGWVVDGLRKVTARLYSGIELAARSGDPVTADLLTELARRADKDLWFLSAHLEAAE